MISGNFGLLLPVSGMCATVHFDFDYAKSNVLRPNDNLQIYHDAEQYINASHDYKIAVFDDWIDGVGPQVTQATVDWRVRVKNASDHVIHHAGEFQIAHLNYILESTKQEKNITFSSSAVIHEPQGLPFVTSVIWFVTTTDLYVKCYKGKLQQLTPFVTKPYYFDYLPGSVKSHRVRVANYIRNNLADKIIASPFFEPGRTRTPEEIEEFWEEGMKDFDFNSSSTAQYNGFGPLASHIIPIKIYNKTCYSIVAETTIDDKYSFYTEKIAKPILASRLFIVFAGKHYLKGLRQMGFKTFDGIIDESYDEIDNNEARWDAALEQVNYLCSQPQNEILEKIIPIVTHNYRQMLNYDWQRPIEYLIEDLFIKSTI